MVKFYLVVFIFPKQEMLKLSTHILKKKINYYSTLELPVVSKLLTDYIDLKTYLMKISTPN